MIVLSSRDGSGAEQMEKDFLLFNLTLFSTIVSFFAMSVIIITR